MSSKYLVNGTIIGGHYEIIDVLGEDDFEILYLVKNIHREGSFFVIKELFLEVFSERKGSNVETIPEALGVFNKRKAEIINEIDNLPRKHIEDEIKVFAYFEENGTIYSCMAYTPNAKVEDYLQFEPKEDAKLPLLEELTKMGQENREDRSPLLMGVLFATVAGALVFAYNQYGAELKKINLLGAIQIEENSTKREKDSLKKGDSLKKILKSHRVAESNKTHKPKREDLWTNNFSLVNPPKKKSSATKQEVPKPERNITKEVAKKDTTTIVKNTIEQEEQVVKEEDNLSSNKKIEELSKSQQSDDNLSEIFSETNIRQFLNTYIETTAHASSKKIMKLYDDKITRYFQFKNITPKKVGKSVRAYNRKWRYRNFKLLDFKVLKRYREDGVNYCDVETRTRWYVSNPNGKKGSGRSKGFMRLKDTKDGIKVKAIYAIR